MKDEDIRRLLYGFSMESNDIGLWGYRIPSPKKKHCCRILVKWMQVLLFLLLTGLLAYLLMRKI